MFASAGEGGVSLDGARVVEEHVSDGLEHRSHQRRREHDSAEATPRLTGLSGAYTDFIQDCQLYMMTYNVC